MLSVKNNRSSLVKSAVVGFMILLFAAQSAAQTRSSLMPTIRTDFQAINSDKNLSKKTLRNEEFMENITDGGGELTGYYKNDSIVKIIEWVGLSYGNRTREFYFKNNKLFFVYEKFGSFVVKDSTGTELDRSKVNTSFEGRYYFNKGKLIAQRTTGKRTFDDEVADVVKELLAAASENIKLLRNNKASKKPAG